MEIDWISGIALIVGIGSLILTWQSTKAAKKSIDTSIKIFESQQKIAFAGKKSQFNTLRKLILDDIKWIRHELLQIEHRFDFIAQNRLLKFYAVRQSDSLNFFFYQPDGSMRHIGFKCINANIDKYVYDIGLLDVDISILLSNIIRNVRHYNGDILLMINASTRNEFSTEHLVNNVRILKLITDDLLEEIQALLTSLKESSMN